MLSLFVGKVSQLKISKNKEVTYSAEKEVLQSLLDETGKGLNCEAFNNVVRHVLVTTLKGKLIDACKVIAHAEMKTSTIVRDLKPIIIDLVEDVL